MPKRKFRLRREEESEEEPDDLRNVLADTALAHEKTRTQGVSVSAALIDQVDQKKEQSITGGMKYYEDVMEKRMQEYVDKNLETQFDTAVADKHVHSRPNLENKAADQESDHHLQTPAVAEVSVPGFNTAITKVSLKSDEPDAPASIKFGKGSSSQEKPRSAPWVPRDLFPKRFGKSKEAISKRSRLE